MDSYHAVSLLGFLNGHTFENVGKRIRIFYNYILFFPHLKFNLPVSLASKSQTT